MPLQYFQLRIGLTQNQITRPNPTPFYPASQSLLKTFFQIPDSNLTYCELKIWTIFDNIPGKW